MAEGTLDGESFSFGCSASKKQEVLSFLRRGLWQRTDRRLMPWRYWQLYAVALAGAFWGL